MPLGAMGGTGDSIPRSIQHWQSWVPPSNTQSTSHGGISTQGPINGFMPNVKNENAFNTNNYYDRPKHAKKEPSVQEAPGESSSSDQ